MVVEDARGVVEPATRQGDLGVGSGEGIELRRIQAEGLGDVLLLNGTNVRNRVALTVAS